MTSPSEMSSALLALSNNLADAAERAGRFVVAVNARSRISSGGVHWLPGAIVTLDHSY
jgi:formyltetrahydrofolate synthetase